MITAMIITYLIILLVFVLYSAMGIYHLWRFGYSGDASKKVIIIYSAIALLIIVTTFLLVNIRLIEG